MPVTFRGTTDEVARHGPTPLHLVTLASLMKAPDAPPLMSEDWERRTRHGWAELEFASIRHGLLREARPCRVEGFRMASCTQPSGLLVAYDAQDAVVGGIHQGNIHVYPRHRGKGLASEMIALAFETGVKEVSDFVMLSPGGRATRRSAHRKAVAHAVLSGLDVPDEVLADYPDLVPHLGPAP